MSVRSVLPQSPVFRIRKPFLSEFKTASKLLFTEVPGETVWKIAGGFLIACISWLQESEIEHFRPVLATRYTPNRALSGLSRQSRKGNSPKFGCPIMRQVLLWSPEAGEVPEPSSNPTLVGQSCCICQHPKLIEGHHVGVGLTLADHQAPAGFEDAA